MWEVIGCYEEEIEIVVSLKPYKTRTDTVWKVALMREIHHPLLVNYWNVYNYSFLEWNFLREERRLA